MFDLTIVDMISKGLVTQEEPGRTDLLETEGSVRFIRNDQYVMVVESQYEDGLWSPVVDIELIQDEDGIILSLELADESVNTYDADEEIDVRVYQLMERNSL